MAGEWAAAKLGDVADLLTGFPFKSDRYIEDETAPRLLRGDNVGQGTLRWDGAKRWPKDAVNDVAEDRPWIDAGLKYASVQAADLPSLLVQRVARLRGKEGLDTRFLKYVIGSRAFTDYVLSVQTGTAVPHISGGQIKSFDFRLPPRQEQRAIAQILGTLDDKIELNQRINETLEAIARATFQSWFVDFDPVRAKAKGHDTGLRKPIEDVFPCGFEESELDQVPQGWTVGSILDQAKLLSGGTPKTDRDDYWNGDIAWASAKDVSQSRDTFLIQTERSITNLGLAESATQKVPACATVVVARGATTGRMILLGHDMAMNQTCYALTSKIDAPFALYCQLRHQIAALVHAAHGSVFDTITTSTFDTARFLLPPAPALLAFERVLQPFFSKILANTEQSITLAALRDALLPKLISGELRVKDAERFVGRYA